MKKLVRKRIRKASFLNISLITTSIPVFSSFSTSKITYHNLSSYKLSQDQHRLCNLGPSFIPRIPDITNQEIDHSLSKFIRNIRIKKCFDDSPINSSFNKKIFIGNSKWIPPKGNSEIEGYIGFTKSTINDTLIENEANTITSNRYITTAKELAAIQEITFCASDKNLGLCILDTDKYNDLAYDHLDDPTTYRKLYPSDFKKFFYDSWLDLSNIFSTYFPNLDTDLVNMEILTDEEKFLHHHRYLQYHIPKFKILPKLHKKGALKGRPIVGATKWITTGPSIIVDIYLQKILEDNPFILKDSKTLVKEFDNFDLQQHHSFFSLDVVSLYPSMQFEQIMLALGKIPNLPPFLPPMIEWIFTNNGFMFEGEYYKQIQGIAMGTNCAPNLANLFMFYLFENHPLIRPTLDKLPLYKRYLDDCFGIWIGTENEFLDFLELCNTIIPGITFTHEFSHDNLVVLDLILYRSPSDTLFFKCYQKEMNKYNYVHYRSLHQPSIKCGFIKGELIRYIRNSSEESNFKIIRRKFKERLLNRGYPKHFISSIFSQVPYKNRPLYLTNKDNTSTVTPIIFCSRYSNRQSKLRLNRSLHLQSSRLKFAFNSDIKIIHANKNNKKIDVFLSRVIPTNTIGIREFGITNNSLFASTD